MISSVLFKSYPAPIVKKEEALRYGGCRTQVKEIEDLLNECIQEALPLFTYKVCYREFPVFFDGTTLDVGFFQTDSSALIKNLVGCTSVIAFAATVGLQADRLMAKYERLSPAKAVILQGLGAERIESLCDLFNADMKEEYEKKGFFLRPRFSPGYGDCPFKTQKYFFSVLDSYHKIGLTLNDSLLMSPTKSVTALIGIGQKKCDDNGKKCTSCNNINCSFRE